MAVARANQPETALELLPPPQIEHPTVPQIGHLLLKKSPFKIDVPITQSNKHFFNYGSTRTESDGTPHIAQQNSALIVSMLEGHLERRKFNDREERLLALFQTSGEFLNRLALRALELVSPEGTHPDQLEHVAYFDASRRGRVEMPIKDMHSQFLAYALPRRW